MNTNIFEQRIDKSKATLSSLQKKFNLLGNLKLACALGIFSFGYYSLKGGPIYNNIMFAVLIGAFIILSIWQSKAKKQINYFTDIIEINGQYIKRALGEWAEFKDNGEEFINKGHDFTYDLDIFGKKSLFQFINTAHTYLGRKKLADKLSSPKFATEQIFENQQATKELSSKLGFCQDFESYSKTSSSGDSVLKVIDYLNDSKPFYSNKALKTILHFMPAAVAPFVFCVYIFNLDSLKIVANLFLVAQLIIWAIGSTKINAYLKGISHYSMKLSGYKELFKLIQQSNFESEKLKSIQETLFQGISAFDAFNDLEKIAQKISARGNALVYLVLNVLLLWDYECCTNMESWKGKYSKYIRAWFDTVSEIETLISFSVLSHVLNETSYPTIDNTKMDIEGSSLGHPLINNEKRISNSFSMKDQILIVSGSNMSGKTTFLRTIGINLVLAYNGSVICGAAFKAPVLDIISSMRVSDDLGEGISTFYAELLKIKRIVNHSKDTKEMIFLIDEIFRGTNSEDRLYGARTVLQDLNHREAIGLITTHDLEICNLDTDKRIINYHFKEGYQNGKIIFDYKLKEGVSKTTNGKQLMKMVGITV
ncbi:MAG: DNA mismatch repair protein MutS [Clostridiales bacterium]|jgi:DNA mismatch repair ATPase MutS|nr:DNA mismatch repair protein MutS [Clostridiales bacterium]